MKVSEVDAMKDLSLSAIELDPGKRHVVVMSYGTPRSYLNLVRQSWKEVLGSEPVIILQRPGFDVLKIFEIEKG